MSVSNQIYSSTVAGLNPLKNVLVSEGEKLVSEFINLSQINLYFFNKKTIDRRSTALRRIMGRNEKGRLPQRRYPK